MIDQGTIDRIIDAAQIVDVVSDFVTLRKRGINYVGLCPFHDDKTPSFYVSPSKGICKCFACGKGGTPVHFIMEHEQMSYYDALKYLAKKYGIEVKERELSDEERKAQSERESLFIVNQFTRDYFHNILMNNIDGKSIGMAYFRSRGFRDDVIEKFQLGFALQKRDSLANEAKRKGFNEKFLIETGLCYQRETGGLIDRFSGRVIFPWMGLSGKVIAFGGRLLDSRTKGVSQKYVNSPDSQIYHKDHELYGIFQAKKAIVKADCVYMVEGYTDVISMHQCGIENVVANSGTALSIYQIQMLHRFTNNIILLYDGDEAGIHAAIRGLDMVLAQGMNVKICLLPDGDDPDSFARKHNAQECKDYITDNAVSFIQFKANLVLRGTDNDPVKRAEMVGNIVQSISVIPEAIVRDAFIKECSQMLHIEDKLLVNEVARKREKAVQQSFERRERSQEATSTTSAESIKDGNGENTSSGSDATQGADTDNGNNLETVQAPNKQTLAPQRLTNEDRVFYKYEKIILQTIIKYGEKIMCKVENEDGGEKEITVIDFVAEDLKRDDLSFHNPTYNTILKEAIGHQHDEGFCAEHYFVNHPDPTISQMCVEMISSRYHLSKYHYKYQKIETDEERLYELVPNLMTNYKYAIIGEELKEIRKSLQTPEISTNQEKCTKLLMRYQELSKTQSMMAKLLGDRVLNI